MRFTPPIPVTVEHVRKTITFAGGAGSGQAGTVVTVFTTTGSVLVHMIVTECTSNLTEAGATATLSLGVTSVVAQFIAATNAVNIDSGEFWLSTTPVAGAIDLPDITQVAAINEDIILNPLVNDTDGGVLVVDCWYEKITDDGLLS